MPFAWLRPELIAAAIRLAKADTDGLEDSIIQVRDRAERMTVLSASGSTNALLLGTWLELDRLESLHHMLTDRDSSPSALAWQYLAAMSAALLGTPDAHDRLDRVITELASTTASGWRDPFVAAFGIESSIALCRNDDALVFAARLEGLHGRFLVLGPATLTLGPIDRYRGLAALAGGDVPAAIERLSLAVESSQRGGATVWAMRSRIELARALHTRSAPGDVDQAAALTDIVRCCAEIGGSPRLARELRVALSTAVTEP